MSLPERLGGRPVSRETMGRLRLLVSLLERWNNRINLVSASTMPKVWERHVVDSAQLFDLRPRSARHWADLGSGGGFPGLVIGIMAADEAPDMKVTLVESDLRKCTFLRTAVRESGSSIDVLSARIEEVPSLNADVVSARALAALPDLLPLVAQHRASDGVALLPKGANWRAEVQRAEQQWRFQWTPIGSKTDPQAVILKIGDLEHV